MAVHIYTLLHSERPNLYGVLAVLSAVGLNKSSDINKVADSISMRVSGRTLHIIPFEKLCRTLWSDSVDGQIILSSRC